MAFFGKNVNISERWYKGITVLIFLLIPVVMYGKYFFSGVYIGDADSIQFFSANKAWISELLDGDYVTWNKYLAAGVPQTSVSSNYIVSIILSVLPINLYIYSYYWFHYFVGALFFYLYLRESGCDRGTCLIFAVIFELSIQINGIRKGHPTVIAGVCLTPLVMYFVKKHLSTLKMRWLLLSALAAALQFSVFLQLTAYLMIVLCVYLVLYYVRNDEKFQVIIHRGISWLVVFTGAVFSSVLPFFLSSIVKNGEGTNTVSYGTFASYSMHPIKLLQAIYPKAFGEVYQAMGIYNSSEMDIEIFLGSAVLILLVFSLRGLKKNSKYIDLICMVISFSITCIAHIPFVNKIIYSIPVLGSFRCSGRALSLVLFFALTLAAKALDDIIIGNVSSKEIRKIGIISAGFMVVTVILLVSTEIGAIMLQDQDIAKNGVLELASRLVEPFISFLAITIVFILFDERPVILASWVLLLTVVNTYPFSSVTVSSVPSTFGMSSEVMSIIGTGDYKVWDNTTAISGARIGIATQNRNVVSKVASLNSYITSNNPYLVYYFKNTGEEDKNVPFNYTGLMTGTPAAESIILYQNDLLSMLGVKYVFDSSGLIEKNNGRACEPSELSVIDTIEEGSLVLEKVTDSLLVGTLSDKIEKGKMYQVSFSVPAVEAESISWLHVDLFGGSDYDLPTQEYAIPLNSGGEYSCIVVSSNVPEGIDHIELRVLATSVLDVLHISQFNVEEVDMRNGTVAYCKVGETQGVSIYENKNAKSLFYFADAVKPLGEDDDIYSLYSTYDLDNTVYLHDISTEISNISSKGYITDLQAEEDYFKCKTKSKNETYLVFSQAYNNNWKVFIDGNREQIDLVNGLVMGVQLSPGDHIIEFKYIDYVWLCGKIIEVLTAVAVLAISYFECKKSEAKK